MPPRPSSAPSSKVSARTAPSERTVVIDGQAVAVAPDGETIAFLGAPPPGASGASQIYLRRLGQDQAVAVADTVDAEGVLFSPDGAWLVYPRNADLWKAPVVGGPAIKLAPVSAGTRGVTWAAGDRLVLAPTWFGGLVTVPAAGGPLTPLTTAGCPVCSPGATLWETQRSPVTSMLGSTCVAQVCAGVAVLNASVSVTRRWALLNGLAGFRKLAAWGSGPAICTRPKPGLGNGSPVGLRVADS